MSDTKTLALIIITQEDKIEEQAKELYRLDLANGNLTEFKETAKLANKNLYEENAKLEEDSDELKSISMGNLMGVRGENKDLKQEIDRLKEENEKIKIKRAKGMLSADIVMKDLFGDGYVYAGMDALRKNIKEKMDRHEKTKEENAELKNKIERATANITLFDGQYGLIAELFDYMGMKRPYCNRFKEATHEAIKIIDNKTISIKTLNALRLHLGKSKRGHELLKQFDRAEKVKK